METIQNPMLKHEMKHSVAHSFKVIRLEKTDMDLKKIERVLIPGSHFNSLPASLTIEEFNDGCKIFSFIFEDITFYVYSITDENYAVYREIIFDEIRYLSGVFHKKTFYNNLEQVQEFLGTRTELNTHPFKMMELSLSKLPHGIVAPEDIEVLDVYTSSLLRWGDGKVNIDFREGFPVIIEEILYKTSIRRELSLKWDGTSAADLQSITPKGLMPLSGGSYIHRKLSIRSPRITFAKPLTGGGSVTMILIFTLIGLLFIVGSLFAQVSATTIPVSASNVTVCNAYNCTAQFLNEIDSRLATGEYNVLSLNYGNNSKSLSLSVTHAEYVWETKNAYRTYGNMYNINGKCYCPIVSVFHSQNPCNGSRITGVSRGCALAKPVEVCVDIESTATETYMVFPVTLASVTVGFNVTYKNRTMMVEWNGESGFVIAIDNLKIKLLSSVQKPSIKGYVVWDNQHPWKLKFLDNANEVNNYNPNLFGFWQDSTPNDLKLKTLDLDIVDCPSSKIKMTPQPNTPGRMYDQAVDLFDKIGHYFFHTDALEGIEIRDDQKPTIAESANRASNVLKTNTFTFSGAVKDYFITSDSQLGHAIGDKHPTVDFTRRSLDTTTALFGFIDNKPTSIVPHESSIKLREVDTLYSNGSMTGMFHSEVCNVFFPRLDVLAAVTDGWALNYAIGTYYNQTTNFFFINRTCFEISEYFSNENQDINCVLKQRGTTCTSFVSQEMYYHLSANSIMYLEGTELRITNSSKTEITQTSAVIKVPSGSTKFISSKSALQPEVTSQFTLSSDVSNDNMLRILVEGEEEFPVIDSVQVCPEISSFEFDHVNQMFLITARSTCYIGEATMFSIPRISEVTSFLLRNEDIVYKIPSSLGDGYKGSILVRLCDQTTCATRNVTVDTTQSLYEADNTDYLSYIKSMIPDKISYWNRKRIDTLLLTVAFMVGSVVLTYMTVGIVLKALVWASSFAPITYRGLLVGLFKTLDTIWDLPLTLISWGLSFLYNMVFGLLLRIKPIGKYMGRKSTVRTDESGFKTGTDENGTIWNLDSKKSEKKVKTANGELTREERIKRLEEMRR